MNATRHTEMLGNGFAYFRFVALKFAGARSHTDRVNWPGLPPLCPHCINQWRRLNNKSDDEVTK